MIARAARRWGGVAVAAGLLAGCPATRPADPQATPAGPAAPAAGEVAGARAAEDAGARATEDAAPAGPAATAPDASAKPPTKDPNERGTDMTSIGSATMRADGTLVLQLRAESDDGTVGDALFTYAPDHPQYRSVLEHLGGLKPGETKPVPPWPDE